LRVVQEDTVMEGLTGQEDGEDERSGTSSHSIETEGDEEEDEDEEYVDKDDDNDDYEEEWRPSKTASSKSSRSSRRNPSPTTGVPARDPKWEQPRVSKVKRNSEESSIQDNVPEDPDDSIMILPTKSTKKTVVNPDSKGDDVPSIPVVKKKR
jgi:hypothetical protein